MLLAIEAKMDQNRHKVKRQRSKKKKKKAGIITQNEQTESAPPTLATWTGELFSSAQLHPGVGHDSEGLMENPCQARRHCPGWCLKAHRCMYTCRSGPHQRAVLSDSSSESLLSVTECRRACSRGLRRRVDPSSMWMEGTSKWTRSAKRRR